MNKYIVVWQEAFDNSDYFVLAADRHAHYVDLHKLATAEIKKFYAELDNEEHPEWYINCIINMTTLVKDKDQ
tara:strand:- start:545 stop:760 length:216 start_codon:yes stop_codon:yes gene_type:complete